MRETVHEAPGMELAVRETGVPVEGAESPLTTAQLEMEIGGWVYDVRPDDEQGIREMLAVLMELEGSVRGMLEALRWRQVQRRRSLPAGEW